MDRNRITRRLAEAGIDGNAGSRGGERPLSGVVGEALLGAGLAPGDIEAAAHELRRRPRDSVAAATLGTGFAAWTLTQSDKVLKHAEDGAEIAEFVHDNIDLLTAGWHEAVPEVAKFLVEFTLRLPSGTIDLGSKVIDLLEHSDALGHAVALKLDGVDVADALDVVDMGASVADVVDGLTTFGLGIAAGWLAKRAVEKHFEPQIQARMARLNALRVQHAEAVRLKEALRTDLPTAVIAGQLQKVDSQLWAF